MKRRTLLFSGLGTASALVVGWGLLPPRSRLGGAGTMPEVDGEFGLNGWIKIGADGSVVLAMPRSEMGQGVHTALAMLAAEELGVPLTRVRLAQVGGDTLYGNVAVFIPALGVHPRDAEPGHATDGITFARRMVAKVAREVGINMTGGSSSVVDAWEVLRVAAATARAQLVGAASLRWKLPAPELRVDDGVIWHASGPRGHYGLFAKEAASTPPGEVRLKARKDWTLIGTAAPRIDLQGKVDGSARFGIDVRLPDQVYAVVRHCPMLGGGIAAVEPAQALAHRGVERVVRLDAIAGSTAAVAVVGRSTWHARQGAQALQIEWQSPHDGLVSSAAIAAALERSARDAAASQRGHAFYTRGDAAQASKNAVREVEQVYRAPYLAHATMEPINCTARVAPGKVEVWAPTQAPGAARAVAARVAGVAEDDVTVHVTYLGGGFGRRLEVDYVAQAVRVARETGGRPVQLVWPREEDITHDVYRPAQAAVLRASLDARGQPFGLQVTSAGDAITPRWMERALPSLTAPFDLPDQTASEGMYDQPYGIPNQRIAHVATRSGVPVGYWRSVGHSHNAFFLESFVDELAFQAGQDPVAFRLGLLRDAPRHAAVLTLAADSARWTSPLPQGRARGVALHESYGSIVAQVAVVSLEGGGLRVHHVVCAADVGTVVNPGIVAQQLESGVVFGLSAALHGRIDIEASVVQQTNFPNHPVLRLAATPYIETRLVPSEAPPGGVGEIAVPPIAPAVANALFALTGERRRTLPLTG